MWRVFTRLYIYAKCMSTFMILIVQSLYEVMINDMSMIDLEYRLFLKVLSCIVPFDRCRKYHCKEILVPHIVTQGEIY